MTEGWQRRSWAGDCEERACGRSGALSGRAASERPEQAAREASMGKREILHLGWSRTGQLWGLGMTDWDIALLERRLGFTRPWVTAVPSAAACTLPSPGLFQHRLLTFSLSVFPNAEFLLVQKVLLTPLERCSAPSERSETGRSLGSCSKRGLLV